MRKTLTLLKRLLYWGAILGLTGLVLSLGVLVGGYLYFAEGLPNFQSLKDYKPPQITRIYDRNGVLLSRLYHEQRTFVDLKDMAPVLVKAVLSAEDADFYRHEGLDYTGMLRALYNSLRAGRLTGSGSTITQQTVKNLLLTHKKSFERKAKELILARRLERKLSKDEILTLYLNEIYLGHRRYGVEEACQFYFGVGADEVSLDQAATLAGLIQSPERTSPKKHPDRARQRRAYVLDQMRKNGYITEAQQAQANAAPIDPVRYTFETPVEARWVVDEIRQNLFDLVGEETAREAGLEVYATLDLERQRLAHLALRAGLSALDKRKRFTRKIKHVKAEERAAWLEQQKKALNGQAPVNGSTAPGRIIAIDEREARVELGVGEGRAARSTLERLAALPEIGDVFLFQVRSDSPRPPAPLKLILGGVPQGALVVMEPKTREVLAMIGGWDHRDGAFNRASSALRQCGSAFKPFVWGAALESMRFTPATIMLDAPETWPLGRGQFWTPKNYTDDYKGSVSLRYALARSINSVAVKLCDEVGLKAVHEFAQRAGLTSPLTDNLTAALGSSAVTPLELVNAYATLADDGRYAAPRLIMAGGIQGLEGVTQPPPPPPPTQTIPPEIAWLLRDVMRSVITQGSGSRLRSIPGQIVGKTGTTNEAKDVWFIGARPDVVVGAWVGFDQPQPLGRKEAGGRTAAPIVKAYLEAAAALEGAPSGPALSWPDRPAAIVEVAIDPKTGLLAPEGVEGTKERFLKDTAPTQVALVEGQINAGTFLMDEPETLDDEDLQLEPTPKIAVMDIPVGDGPPVRVPSIEIAPLPETLGPSGGVRPAERVRVEPLSPHHPAWGANAGEVEVDAGPPPSIPAQGLSALDEGDEAEDAGVEVDARPSQLHKTVRFRRPPPGGWIDEDEDAPPGEE
ncbi:PBP1A family penicillin-binding protein [Myxococcota bacterium]|nr:PBP1A family penicillin-binding protein [Myxococcota bacterium]MBU1898737.1 PBP1A family penicillin-binding protein [Myxococcota bacterium]